MILFEDMADRAGILKAIQDLSDANVSYGNVAEETNNRIRQSIVELRKELISYQQLVQSAKDPKVIVGLKDDVVNLTTAYKSQNTSIAENQRVIESNNKVTTQMQERLKALQKEYEKLDLSQKNDLKRKREIEGELTQTTRALKGLTTATEASRRTMKAAEGSVDALRKSTTDLKNQLNALPDAYEKGTDRINKQNQAAVKLNAQYQQSIGLLKKIEAGQQNNRLNVGNYPKGVGGGGAMSSIASFAGLATGAGIASAVFEAGKAVIEVGQNYERLGLLTENALKNNKAAAKEANALIVDFANKSPLEIEEVTNAFNRLVTAGIIPTKEQLTEISDIAIAKNKTVMDYVEAIADAEQGQYRRLEEFGINASKAGDKIIFTYNGVRTTVDDNSTAIANYLINLGKVPGIMGATEKLSQAFWGRWSTIKDDIKGVANDIYQIMLPALNALAGGFSGGLGILKTYTTGLREMYKFAGLKGAIAGFIGDPTLAYKLGQQAQEKQAKAGTPELDKARKQLEAENKINDEKRKKAEADEKYKKDAAKREAAANKALTDNLNNSKAATDIALAANEAAQQTD